MEEEGLAEEERRLRRPLRGLHHRTRRQALQIEERAQSLLREDRREVSRSGGFRLLYFRHWALVFEQGTSGVMQQLQNYAQ